MWQGPRRRSWNEPETVVAGAAAMAVAGAVATVVAGAAVTAVAGTAATVVAGAAATIVADGKKPLSVECESKNQSLNNMN